MMGEIKQAKVILLGEANVGKSSLINRFISNNFSDHSDPTIGATFLSKIVDFDSQSVKLNIWDTAGQERYNSLAASYSRDSRACVLVYDITSKDSFQALQKWHNNIKDIISSDVVIAVVGNKEDMVDREAVSLAEAKNFAESIKALHMRTSAKHGDGVKELFVELGRNILGNKDLCVRDTFKSSRGISLSSQTPPKIKGKKGCCG